MADRNTGKILQIIGAVLDIRFEGGLPALYNAIEVKHGDEIVVLEVAQHLGDNIVRCISMASTDGLVRGMEAVDTGAPITVPVGSETLGRMMNVLGKAIDEKPEPESKERWAIHRPAPGFSEQAATAELLETGIKS
ncbi:MAG: F0F1 ATP synthase subunit beta, partial [Oscillospiraceae bacterium]|nr:F0F1 ATP synthase subunit beta [Oscillospiraceae bacterium]